MTTTKLALASFVFAIVFIVACSTTETKAHLGYQSNFDTTYTIYTRQLKSDQIPDSVFQMTSLRHLSVVGEDCDVRQFDSNGKDITECWMIQDIPASIKNLKHLETLQITLNSLHIIPNELSELDNLTSIDLTDNGSLTNIDAITKLPNLQYLYLYGCHLNKLPQNIGDLKNLKELGLVGNGLDKDERLRIKKALPNCDIKF